MSEKIINFASRFYPDLIASSGNEGILADSDIIRAVRQNALKRSLRPLKTFKTGS